MRACMHTAAHGPVLVLAWGVRSSQPLAAACPAVLLGRASTGSGAPGPPSYVARRRDEDTTELLLPFHVTTSLFNKFGWRRINSREASVFLLTSL